MVAPSLSTDSPPAAPLAVSVDLPSAQVRVSGELDRVNAHHLEDAMVMLTTRPGRRWRLDAGDVTFCDAEGLRVLSNAHALAAEHGRSLQLVRTSRSVDRLVDLLGRERVFPTSGSRRATVPPAWTRHIRCGTTGTP